MDVPIRHCVAHALALTGVDAALLVDRLQLSRHHPGRGEWCLPLFTLDTASAARIKENAARCRSEWVDRAVVEGNYVNVHLNRARLFAALTQAPLVPVPGTSRRPVTVVDWSLDAGDDTLKGAVVRRHVDAVVRALQRAGSAVTLVRVATRDLERRLDWQHIVHGALLEHRKLLVDGNGDPTPLCLDAAWLLQACASAPAERVVLVSAESSATRLQQIGALARTANPATTNIATLCPLAGHRRIPKVTAAEFLRKHSDDEMMQAMQQNSDKLDELQTSGHADRIAHHPADDPLAQTALAVFAFSHRDSEAASRTAVMLQYAHARLHSICTKHLDEAGGGDGAALDWSSLQSNELVWGLARQLALTDSVFEDVNRTCDLPLLLQHAVELVQKFSAANVSLRVKGMPEHLARPRRALLQATRQALVRCLEVLGIEPQRRM